VHRGSLHSNGRVEEVLQSLAHAPQECDPEESEGVGEGHLEPGIAWHLLHPSLRAGNVALEVLDQAGPVGQDVSKGLAETQRVPGRLGIASS